jgi:ribose transport system permease protein
MSSSLDSSPAGSSTDIDTEAAVPARSDDRGRAGLRSLALPVGLVGLLVIGTLLSDRFLSVANLLNVLTSMSLVGIVVVGMTFVIVSGGLADLSVPATLATGAIVMLSAQPTVGTALALVLAVVAAGLAGLVNGVLIGYGRANPIIVTLGVGTIVLGLAQAIVGGAIVYGDEPELAAFVNGRVLGLVPFPVLVFAIVAVLGHLALSRSVWGRWTYAVGSNYRATEASAVPVRAVRAAAFLVTGLLAGLSGALLAISLQSVRPVIGTGYEFDAITAVLVGGVSVLGGFGSIPRAVAGLFFVQLLTNILVLQGISTPAQGLAKGALIAVAVGVDVHLRRRGGL